MADELLERKTAGGAALAGENAARLLDEILAALHHLGARADASARLDSGTMAPYARCLSTIKPAVLKDENIFWR